VFTFLVTLHVLATVLIIGPFALVAFMGDRAVRRHDAPATRRAASLLGRFGLGTLVVAVLGAGALGVSDRYSFKTPWVIISLTLYIVGMGIATGYTVPALRRAAGILEQGVLPEQVAPAALPAEGDPAPAETPGVNDLVIKERLDNIAGRIVGSSVLVLVTIVLITILMTARPFGH
jgi:uncharacterized membrane protein